MSSHPQTPPEVFVSYSHHDKDYKDQLVKQLNVLQRQGVISSWHDGLLVAGEKWNDEIVEHLNSSRIILLLVTPDFMNSDYIHNVELRRASERHESGEVSVVPVLVRNVNSWDNEPFGDLRLGDFQALPTGMKFIVEWDNLDKAFTNVAKGIQEVAKKLKLTSTKTASLAFVPRPPVVGFVARTDSEGRNIVARLKEELAPQMSQLVALWGGGGAGKTTLAAEVARELATDFSDRVVWVSADSRNDLPFSTFLDEIATQLGDDNLRKLAPELKAEAVRTLVAMAPTLIVLDNFETISAEERQRSLDFLQRVQCSALITTRQRLEHARSVPIAGMTRDEAETFLALLVEQTQDAEIFSPPVRKRITETAEANPLIMEWIVGQIDLANDPEEVLSDLTHGEGEAAHRVFDRSYNLPQLNDGGRAVLLALSLFTPSAGRPTLAAVAGMDLGRDKDKRRFKKAQETLASLWLIKKMDGGLRLAVAGLTRELTKAHLAADIRAKTIPQRFVSHFVRYAKAHVQPTGKDYDALELEKENLVAASDIAFGLMDLQSVLRLAYTLALPSTGVLSVRGYWDEAQRIGGQALMLARSSQFEDAVARWSHNLAIMYQDRGEPAQARGLYNESFEIQTRLGDQKSVSYTLHQLATLAQDEGKFDEARRLYYDSLEIKKELADQKAITATLHQLGMLAQDQGELDEARRLYDESLEMCRSLDFPIGIAATLHQLGTLAQSHGDFEEARRLYDESFDIKQTLGDRQGIATYLHELGTLALEQDKPSEARDFYEKSIGITQKLGDQLGTAGNLHDLGMLSLIKKDYATAETLLRDSLDLLTKLGDKQNSAECIESIGRLRVAQGQLVEARIFFEEALGIAEELRLPFRIGSIKHALGLMVMEQDKAFGTQLLREAMTLFERLRSPKAEGVRSDLNRFEANGS